MPGFLVIEDNVDHQELLLDIIHDTFEERVNVKVFDLLAPGLEFLAENPVDILLCDLQLPDSSIEETVQVLQNVKTDVPIIVLTSLNDTSLAKTLIKSGIQDYLPKEELTSSLLYRASTYARERKQNQLMAEERNRDYKAFCYSLSHDFNAGLRHVDTFATFLRQSLEERDCLNEQEKEYLNYIHSDLHYIRNLITDLYNYLSVDSETIALSSIQLVTPITEAINILSATIDEKNAQITVDLDPSLNIEGYPAHLQLLFQNLIDNGMKYNTRPPEIIIRQAKFCRPQHITLAIEDNGIGIKEEYFVKIFTPFQRLHSRQEYQGSGLGLNIVKRIVQQYQGRIWVNSEYGKGSTFFIELPLKQKQMN